jgi:Multicopper oxidase
MKGSYALFGSVLLLGILIIGVSLAAYALTPSRGAPKTTTVTVQTTANTLKQTDLVLTLILPNGTHFVSGKAQIGLYSPRTVNGSYYFQNINPGMYSLNLTGAPGFFVLPFTMKLVEGVKNLVNETIYPLQYFVLVETSGLSYNDTQPGPLMKVHNATAVTVEILNNTTQINNFAIVLSLSNSSQSNIMFNSLSDNLPPGGSTNDTFIVNSLGSFYYTSLIGSQSKDGQYGYLDSVP